MSLAFCSACRRHVRPGACAFCGAEVRAATRSVAKRASRAALYAMVAVGPFDCMTPAPAYGGPPNPPPTAAVAPDSGIDAAVISVAAYGAAAPPPPKPSVEIGPIQKEKK